MILLCVTLHRVCYPNSNCVQDYMTPEQYQILFFSYEQFKQLNFFIVKVPPRVVSFCCCCCQQPYCPFGYSFLRWVSDRTILFYRHTRYFTGYKKHRWDCTNFLWLQTLSKSCSSYREIYSTNLLFFLLVYLLFSCIKKYEYYLTISFFHPIDGSQSFRHIQKSSQKVTMQRNTL